MLYLELRGQSLDLAIAQITENGRILQGPFLDVLEKDAVEIVA